MTLLQAYLNSPKARRALSKKPGQAGFSLIELVVVVAVLAVLSAIAIPSFTNISGKARATAAANTIATVAKECAAKIADAGSGTYTVPSINGYTGWAESSGGGAQTIGDTRNCLNGTGVYEATSSDPDIYPTWRYNVNTAAKTCVATTTASQNRGCTNSSW